MLMCFARFLSWMDVVILVVVICPFLGTITRGEEKDVPSSSSLREILPILETPSAAVVNQSLAGSQPSFSTPLKAPAGAPNVLLVLIDDAGFGNHPPLAGRSRHRRSTSSQRKVCGTTGSM